MTLNLRRVYIILKKAKLEMKFKLKNLKYFGVDYFHIRGEVVPDIAFLSYLFIYLYTFYLGVITDYPPVV